MTDPEPQTVTDKGVLARAIGIVFSPGETFAEVVRNPRPAGILLLVCIVIALATGLPQFTQRGRQMSLDMQVSNMEKFTGQAVTPEVYAQMEQRASFGAYIAMGSIFVALPVITLFFTALYWAVFNTILGGTASFKQVLGLLAHSQVIGALGAAVSAPVQYFQDVQTATGPFNLGALLPMLEPGSFPANFLGAISFFMLWQLVVSAIGLAVLYRRRATTIAVSLIVLYIAAVAIFTIGLSRFMGR
jgi:hypothetical protein